MDIGTMLTLRAILFGLRRSGLLGQHALIVICDELRLAADDARRQLFDREAEQIEQLIIQLNEAKPLLMLCRS